MRQIMQWIIGLLGVVLFIWALALVFPPLAIAGCGVFLLRLAYIL